VIFLKEINISMTVEQYKNIHLLLHNLIQLSDMKNQYNPIFKEMGTSLKIIKTALEVKS
jgi:hypothetical protein